MLLPVQHEVQEMSRRNVKQMAKKTDARIEAWIRARQRHHLSHTHVQMAQELGMNPEKLGKIDNHGQELWKAPLPEFIEHLYEKRFGKERPDVVTTIEQRAMASAREEAERKARKRAHRAATTPSRE